jgi:hypothetical protein
LRLKSGRSIFGSGRLEDAPACARPWFRLKAYTWSTLDPGAQPKKRILVHISAAQDRTLSGTIDYPDQDTSGIVITAITYKEPALHFESSSSLGFYDGTIVRMSDDGPTIFN